MWDSSDISPWYWAIAGLILAALEVILPGIYLLWLGLGALLAGALLFLLPGIGLGWQLMIFAMATTACVAIGFWVQRRGGVRQGDAVLLNQELQAFVGKRYEAIGDFQAGRGRLRVGDTSYAAISDQAIAAGETVQVIAIDDGRLRVARPDSQ